MRAVSYSSVSMWRECQQEYWYRYVDILRPKVEEVPLTLGRMLHTALEEFYRGGSPKHALAILDQFQPQLDAYAAAAHAMDEPELGAEFAGLCDKAKAITTRYLLVRGKEDKERYSSILTEERIEYPLTDTINAVVVIDLVTEDIDGHKHLWEHKTTKNVPSQGYRMRDLQTLWAAAMLAEARGIKVEGIVWNYLRTKEPTRPQVLQNGTLTKRKDLDTTWHRYQQEIFAAGLNEDDYLDVKERLEDKEMSVYFPRIEIPILQDERILLRDFIATAKEMEHCLDNTRFTPVRNIGRKCDYCTYSKLCDAVILHGHDADSELKARLFTIERR